MSFMVLSRFWLMQFERLQLPLVYSYCFVYNFIGCYYWLRSTISSFSINSNPKVTYCILLFSLPMHFQNIWIPTNPGPPVDTFCTSDKPCDAPLGSLMFLFWVFFVSKIHQAMQFMCAWINSGGGSGCWSKGYQLKSCLGHQIGQGRLCCWEWQNSKRLYQDKGSPWFPQSQTSCSHCTAVSQVQTYTNFCLQSVFVTMCLAVSDGGGENICSVNLWGQSFFSFSLLFPLNLRFLRTQHECQASSPNLKSCSEPVKSLGVRHLCVWPAKCHVIIITISQTCNSLCVSVGVCVCLEVGNRFLCVVYVHDCTSGHLCMSSYSLLIPVRKFVLFFLTHPDYLQ